MSSSRRLAKRLLANPAIGRVAARVTMHQIRAYERRLPLLWNLYAHIPDNPGDTRIEAGEQERLLHSYYNYLADHIPTLPLQPLISVAVPVYRPRPEYLQEALDSVAVQTYRNWQLCIADDHSDDAEITRILQSFADRHPGKVRLVNLETNQGIAGASNAALALASGDFVALLDHDDRLYPQALAEVVRHINLAAEAGARPQILFSDERVIGEHGQPLNDPFCKPDWSPLMHLSVNYTTHLSVYERELLEAIGGFRAGFDGSQDHDLMLRAVEAAQTPVVHIPSVLYQWRAHQTSTAHSLDAKPEAVDAGIKAVSEACQRRGHPAKVTFEPATGHYRLDFEISDPQPRVSIVIPTRNAASLLQRCTESILDRSSYRNFELILVDNASDEPAAVEYLARLEQRPDVTVVEDEGYFNFGRLCNHGARAAQGEYLLFLNNDTEVISPGWLEAMVGLAQMPNTGAVGAKLLYEDGRVQHAGVVGLADVIAGHIGRGRPSDDPMYIHIINTLHETLAVTGACLLVDGGKFEQAGGWDERWVPNAYGDVDLCLRLRSRGFQNAYTPHAVLWHSESPSRKLNIETFERDYMRRAWPAELLTDPFLNPNLLRGEVFAIDHRFQQPEVPRYLFEALLARSTSNSANRASSGGVNGGGN